VHSEKILKLFADRTGLDVMGAWDVERNKTVGLVNRLLAEQNHPRADVYWNNEIAHTIRLKKAGLTQPYASPSAEGIPFGYKDADHHWTGFAARARVFLQRTDKEVALPARVYEMAEPQFARHGAMAAPLTGTTLTHFSALSLNDSSTHVLTWLDKASQSGLKIGAGNADVMRRTCEGDVDWCLTDTDDAAAARRNGHPVEVVFPDQGEGGRGALLIPNTVCMIANAPHPDAARQFIDFVLSAEVEALLAASDSEQIPLRPGVDAPDYVKLPGRDFHATTVNWEAVANELDQRFPDFQKQFVK
jgi:iron(III) transport system substrate-binding protein